jgi:hypothetical protein
MRPAFMWNGAMPSIDTATGRSWTRGASITPHASIYGIDQTFTPSTANGFTKVGSTVAQTAVTFVCVLTKRTNVAFEGLLTTSFVNGGFRLSDPGAGNAIGLVKGTVAGLSTVSILNDVPYVLVCSHRQDTGEYYLLVKSLLDGSILRASGTNTSASTAGDGTYAVGYGRGDSSESWSGQVGLAFCSFDFLHEDLGRQLLANPWQLFLDQPRLPWVAEAAGGSTDTPINPGVGALALTGYAPTLAQTANQALTPGVGSIGVTGYAPTITQGVTTDIAPGVGTLALTGYAPTLAQTANQALVPDAGVMSITGYAPTITQAATSPNLTPDVGQITITGYAPLVTQSGQQDSGGFFEVPQVKRRRSVKEERELLGIIPREVKQVIQAVARASVVADKTDDQAARQLAARLEQQDIEAKARYTEFMQKERDRILSRDIERALRIKQRQAEMDDDEESAVMLLM